jgi:hypothetical protein
MSHSYIDSEPPQTCKLIFDLARCAKAWNRDHPGEKRKTPLHLFIGEFIIFVRGHAGNAIWTAWTQRICQGNGYRYAMSCNFADRVSVENVSAKSGTPNWNFNRWSAA